MDAPWSRLPPVNVAEVATDDDDFLTVDKWPREVFEPHFHEEFNWIVPMRPGRVVVRVDDREHALDGNHWICILPRTPHTVVHVSDHCEVLSLFVPDALMLSAYRELDPAPTVNERCIVGGAGTIARGLALAWGELRFAPQRRTHDRVDAALEQLVAGWIWRAYRPVVDSLERWDLRLRTALGPLADGVLAFFEAHLADTPFPWDGFADAIGQSRRTVQRRFVESVGTSPSAVLTGLRLERGRELLRDPSRSIGDVALASGFTTQSHFSTAFKIEFGVTPAQFRRAVA
jgi:AraC-like DNA-binding protein